jgi:hypothetical protein
MLHGLLTEDAIVAIENAAEDFLVPLTAWSPAGGASADLMVRGLSLDGRGLRFESCKEPEEGRGLVVRCTNVLNRPVEGSWSLPGIAEAFLCRLDELPLGALPVVEGRVAFQAPPFAVTTILLRQREE